MFCPECQVEYRPGFTRCSDCDVDLVETLPPGSSPEVIQIWVGDDQDRCVVLCQELKDAGVRYEVSEAPKSRGKGMQVNWRYQLSVSVDDEKRAKEILELPETVVEEDSEAEEDEVPNEVDELPSLPEGDQSTGTKRDKSSSYLAPWYPEDATVEIFEETATFESGLIEMSLKENLIRARVEVQENRLKKVFVMPEDEAAAREIVREIVENSPPN